MCSTFIYNFRYHMCMRCILLWKKGFKSNGVGRLPDSYLVAVVVRPAFICCVVYGDTTVMLLRLLYSDTSTTVMLPRLLYSKPEHNRNVASIASSVKPARSCPSLQRPQLAELEKCVAHPTLSGSPTDLKVTKGSGNLTTSHLPFLSPGQSHCLSMSKTPSQMGVARWCYKITGLGEV